jgi:hypothetical protein
MKDEGIRVTKFLVRFIISLSQDNSLLFYCSSADLKG